MKPILFNTAMVRAILDGRKTVTRRVVKPQAEGAHYVELNEEDGMFDFICGAFANGMCIDYVQAVKPPYKTGDILYVRETWTTGGNEFFYRADFDSDFLSPCETLTGGYPSECRYYDRCEGCTRKETRIQWKPSIHMPKEAARIFLRVTNVRVERLQDIMNDPPGPNNQVVREGCKYGCDFIALWDRTIKETDKPLYGWDANPWVWVIEFERIDREEAHHG